MDEQKLRKYAGLPLNESVEKIDEAVGTPQDLVESVHFLSGQIKTKPEQKVAIDLMKKNFKGREITNAVIVLETLIELLADEFQEGKEEKGDLLAEAVASWRNPGKGSDINLSTSDFSDAAIIEASFSSGKVIGASLVAKQERKVQEKSLEKKLKAVIKLHQKFEKDVKGALEK